MPVDHEALTRRIIGTAMMVHRELGPGFLESVYRHALAHELARVGMPVETEKRIAVRYRGVPVGEFVADLVVDGRVIVEAKAVRTLASAHEVQLVNYLTATGIDVGILVNFGAASLEFRRRSRLFRPPHPDPRTRRD